jgi:hypothetical protein
VVELHARAPTHRAPRNPGTSSSECRHGPVIRNAQTSCTTGVPVGTSGSTLRAVKHPRQPQGPWLTTRGIRQP